jgi:hypothetical protein
VSKRKKQKEQSPPRAAGAGILSVLDISIPEELRMPPVVDASGLRTIKEKVADLEEQIGELRKGQKSAEAEVVPSSVVRVFTHIATNAWRAKIKMVDSETGEPKEDMRRVYRHIEAVFESLKGIGIETIDPTGRAYDSGMALKVISFEQTPGLSKEEIKETIKPAVTWQGRLIQMGEVIVGTPQNVTDSERKADEQNNH